MITKILAICAGIATALLFSSSVRAADVVSSSCPPVGDMAGTASPSDAFKTA